MHAAVLDNPIVESISKKTVDLITDDNVAETKRESNIEVIIDQIYEHSSTTLTEDETTILKFAIEDIFQRYATKKRKTGIPYVNHPISVARFLASGNEDIHAILGGLYHDAIEEHVSEEFKKTLDEETDALIRRKAIDIYGRSFSTLRKNEKKKVTRATKFEKRELRTKTIEEFKKNEPEMIQEYMDEMISNFKEKIIGKGINDELATITSENLKQIVTSMTRSYFADYYQAIDHIISPQLDISPENKFRAVRVKFADCYTNTEVITDSVYTVEDLETAIARNDIEELKSFKRRSKKASKQHNMTKKTRVPGHKRVYRTYKNYFLINSSRVYDRHMSISQTFDGIRQNDKLRELMEDKGFLEQIKKLTRNYNTNKRISREAVAAAGKELIGYFKGSGSVAEEGQEIISFVRGCVKSNFFRYIKTFDEFEQIVDNHMREDEAYTKARDRIKEYENALVKRNQGSANQILDHLVSYHALGPHLTHEKAIAMIRKNKEYAMAGGYKFITKPTGAVVKLLDDKKGSGTGILLQNGTRKTLETPDGIILVFIDAKVRGDNTRLSQLYSNKANMFWAALASKTLGDNYQNSDYILIGLDTKGVHPSRETRI
ncbi:hypothetical protein HOH15_07935 [Candidatus Woesearchaeota archaeon]|nr:hypothetical protein [Candidatus Woesearchaeota archaeon]